MKVMLFNASPKNYGATQEILNTVKEALPKDAQTDEVCLGEVQLKFCIGCKRCYDTHGCVQGEEVREILNRMDACDAVVVACPELLGGHSGAVQGLHRPLYPLFRYRAG